MLQDSDAIVNSLLFQQLEPLQGSDRLSESDITALKGLIVSVANNVGPHLARIQQTFTQYTAHDLGHIANVADLAYAMLPKRSDSNEDADIGNAVVRLNALEVSLLWLAILLHDIGMFVGDAERASLMGSDDYKKFLRRN